MWIKICDGEKHKEQNHVHESFQTEQDIWNDSYTVSCGVLYNK